MFTGKQCQMHQQTLRSWSESAEHEDVSQDAGHHSQGAEICTAVICFLQAAAPAAIHIYIYIYTYIYMYVCISHCSTQQVAIIQQPADCDRDGNKRSIALPRPTCPLTSGLWWSVKKGVQRHKWINYSMHVSTQNNRLRNRTYCVDK
jgi:hypothetical protein